MPKKQMGMRLSEGGVRIVKVLAEKLGVSRTAVVEMALRRMADPQSDKEFFWGLKPGKKVSRG